MRIALGLAAAALLATGCASDCEKICGKLELCEVGCSDQASCAQSFNRDECLRRCERGGLPPAQGGAGGGGGTGGSTGTGGAGGGEAGGSGGAATGGGGSAEPEPDRLAPSVKNCASCVDQIECSDLLQTLACDALCPEGLSPADFRSVISNP